MSRQENRVRKNRVAIIPRTIEETPKRARLVKHAKTNRQGYCRASSVFLLAFSAIRTRSRADMPKSHAAAAKITL